MTKSVSQIVHEAMGLKWSSITCRCMGTCGHSRQFPKNPNYLEHGKAWGELLKWAIEQEWWSDFIECMCQRTLKVHKVAEHLDEVLNLAPICVYETGAEEIIKYLIANPRSLPEHIVSYLEEVKDGL